MPDNNQPKWFDADWYAEQKVAQHNVMYPEDIWTLEQYNRALASFNATNWQNWQTEYGNADNVSPNPLFNEAYYFTALAENSSKELVEGRDDWTPTEIMRYLKSKYNASGWDHYTVQGQYEGLNPSAEFDTNAYFQTRVDMLNEYNDGKGWDGRNDWSIEDYKNVMRDYGINPIMDLFIATDYGQENASMKITPVSGALTPPDGWTPWDAVEPAWVPQETTSLTQGQDNITGNPVPTLFKAVVAPGDEGTLQPDDQIRGVSTVENHLEIQLKGNFQPGFNGVNGGPNVTGIQEIDLVNAGGAAYEFVARNIRGVAVWNLDCKDAPIDLSALPSTVVNVNISNLAEGRSSISYDPSLVGGVNDALTLGLEHVGQGGKDELTPAMINSPGIERLTIVSNGDAQNVADISGVNSATELVVNGAADLAVTAVNPGMSTINCGGYMGALTLMANAAPGLGTITLGSGDDLVATSGLPANAVIAGGFGNDTLQLNGARAANYNLNMNGVENLVINGNWGELNFDASQIRDLNTLSIVDSFAPITLIKANLQSLTVNLQNAAPTEEVPGGGSNLTLNGVNNLNLVVGGEESSVYAGALSAWGTKTINLDLSESSDFSGALMAADANTLTVSAASGSSLDLNANPALAASNLGSISSLNLGGEGDLDFHLANVGQNVRSMQVNASGFSGGFAANFTGSREVADQSIRVNGGSGGNQIKINNNYNSIHITSGEGADDVDLSAFSSLRGVDIYINLGGGDNSIYVSASCEGDIMSMIGKQIFGVQNIIIGEMFWDNPQ